ncbi:MAG: peptide chain release factor N(5)-glutamine methyltransferase [Clostridia bacterium]|nr:peptide chain release factor N(5)-glutamine methyltransferase [Clostridia bacterium]
MTIEENLKIGLEKLKKKKIEEPRKIARLLLCFVLKMRKEEIVVYGTKELTKKEEEEYQNSIQKLEEGYPLQYITHHQEFMKLDFYVDEKVLIPRADTEITVEEVIWYSKNKPKNLRILDLCTGSGAIAISLGKYLPNCEIVAVDISKEALKIAKKNAKQNEVNNITFVQSNLFEKVRGTFDIIVSNPPYIKTGVIETLEPQVQKEPILALDGGGDGLMFYRKILTKAGTYLKQDGAIFLEIGYDQKEEVVNIIQETKEYEEIQTKKDLSGNNRMVMAKKRSL